MKLIIIVLASLFTIGCATTDITPYDYSNLRAEKPKSVLVVPAVNRTVDVDAPDYFLSTISKPLAERGYYVYPVHAVKRVMEDDGLNDADLVHGADPARLGTLFGADAILYVSIERWDAQYIVLSTTVTVDFNYVMKSATTGATLWEGRQQLQYTPDDGGGGLIGAIVNAAIAKAAPNYIPLTQQANSMVLNAHHRGLPAGPYQLDYLNDEVKFDRTE